MPGRGEGPRSGGKGTVATMKPVSIILQVSQLMACLSLFVELNLVDEALLCLRDENIPSEKLTCLFELPLTRQLPFLLYLNEENPHEQSIHARLLLLGEGQVSYPPMVNIVLFQYCDLSSTCQFISAWKAQDWLEVTTLDTSSVDLSILPSDALEMIEMTADWHLKRSLPECLHQLSGSRPPPPRFILFQPSSRDICTPSRGPIPSGLLSPFPSLRRLSISFPMVCPPWRRSYSVSSPLRRIWSPCGLRSSW